MVIHNVVEMPPTVNIHHRLVIRTWEHLRHQLGNLVREMEHVRGRLGPRFRIQCFDVHRDLEELHLRENDVRVHPDQGIDADRTIEADVADAFDARTVLAEEVAQCPAQFQCLAHYEAAEDRVVQVSVFRMREDYVR